MSIPIRDGEPVKYANELTGAEFAPEPLTSVAAGRIRQIGNASATTIGGVGVPVKAAGFTGILSGNLFDAGGLFQNRIRYTGTETKSFHLHVFATISSADGAKEIRVGLYKNGVTPETELYPAKPVAATTRTVYTDGCTQLATDDYLELFVANDTDATNITVTDFIFSAFQI